MINCELFERHVGAFVDGELDPHTQMEFDGHLEGCPECQERMAFEGVYREQVREAGDAIAPSSLHERVRLSLQNEQPPARAALALPLVLPFASAAAVALVVGGVYANQPVDEEAAFEDVVRLHNIQLPADITVNEETGMGGEFAPPVQQVSHWFRDKGVAFPVRPAEFAQRDVRLVGARLSNVRERRAAALYYELQDGQRLTVVVTDANVQDDDTEELQVGDHSVLFRDVHGHSVPLRREGNLSYAFTGDVDRETLLRLAATARVRP